MNRGWECDSSSRLLWKSAPNVFTLTFDGVRVVSLRFCPVRALSLCSVQSEGMAWAAMAAQDENRTAHVRMSRWAARRRLGTALSACNDMLLPKWELERTFHSAPDTSLWKACASQRIV